MIQEILVYGFVAIIVSSIVMAILVTIKNGW